MVDIGCNKGYYSARAHKRFAPTEAISAKTVGQAHKEWLGRRWCPAGLDRIYIIYISFFTCIYTSIFIQ